MAMTKKYDLVVKAGIWKDKHGVEKASWKNVGKVLVGDDGNEMYLLDKTFNPAGISDGKESVVIYRFEPKSDVTHAHSTSNSDVADQALDDEIPF